MEHNHKHDQHNKLNVERFIADEIANQKWVLVGTYFLIGLTVMVLALYTMVIIYTGSALNSGLSWVGGIAILGLIFFVAYLIVQLEKARRYTIQVCKWYIESREQHARKVKAVRLARYGSKR